MNLLALPSTSSLPPAALWVLADAAIKSALLLLAAALLAGLLRKSSAAARHLTWSGAVAGTLLLPLLSFLLPAWRAPWLPDWSEVKIAVISPAVAIVHPPASVSVVQATTVAVHESISTPPPDAIAPTPFPLWSWALPLWLAGAALALLPLAAGAWQMARLTRRCIPITETEWLALLARVSTDLGLRRRVELRHGPGVNAPLTWGAWRPVLLLPEAARAWPAERRRVVLLHELAHIKRWDWLTQTLAYLGCALYWFNPLAWLAARCMRIERERACDDLVLHHGSRPSDYADELLKFASTLGGSGLVNWAAVPMARRSTLEGRLLAILDARRNRSALTRAAVLAALALVAAVVVPIAMLRAAPEENPPAPAASIPATPAPTPAPLESNPPAPPSSVILRGTIFSVPPDVHVDPANTSVDQLLGQLSATSSVLITPAPVSTLPVGVSTGFKARNGFHFSNPTKWVVVDFQFHALVDVTGGHLHYKIDSTHTHFPDGAPSPPSTPMDDLRNIANSANGGSVMESQDANNPRLAHPTTIIGNTTWNQSFICDLGPSGDDPASNYRVLAMFVFEPGPATTINSITAPTAASTPALSLTPNSTSGATIRIFPLLPSTAAVLLGSLPPLSSDEQIAPALQKIFQDNGVSFDGDAGLYYDLKTSQLVAKNTTDNLDRIAAILQKNREQEVIASMETRSFPMPQATLMRLTGQYVKKHNTPVYLSGTTDDDDPAAQEAIDDLKNFFVNADVAFPVGARVAYDGAKIWVTNTPNNLDRLANLLQRYSEIKQVQIDAKFLEVQQGVLQQLGVPGTAPNPGNSSANGNATSVAPAVVGVLEGMRRRPADGNRTFVSITADPGGNGSIHLVSNITRGTTDSSSGAVNDNNPAASTNGFSSLLDQESVQNIFHAIEQTPGASLMSAPKVTVLSEKEAVITVTQNGLKPPNSSYATDPIGVTFKVLPVVKDDNSVDYSIKAWITELVSAQSASGGVVQRTNVTELVTSGHALDGQTVAFDLTGEPAPPNPAASGNNTTATPPPAPTRHRYAIFTFNIIHSDGTFARVPSSNASPPASSSPPAKL